MMRVLLTVMQTIIMTTSKVLDLIDERERAIYHHGNGSLLATQGTYVEHPQDGELSFTRQASPYVGQPATVLYWSDRHAATVIAVSKSGYKVTVRECRAVRVDDNGMSDCQSYRYEEDEAGKVHTMHRRADGSYGKLALGIRDHYFDYSF